MSAKTIVLATVSDIHCGSTVGMVPPEGVKLDDGGVYRPSRANSWLWECWEKFWQEVRVVKSKNRASLYVIYNGDFWEGDHHKTTQIISPNPEPTKYLASRILSVPQTLKPKHQFMVRGTEAHVGASGAEEEALAREYSPIFTKDPENDTYSWWQLKLDINGVFVEAQHHGKMGRLAWTRGNAALQQAADVFMSYAQDGERHPDLCFRSHLHKWADSYKVQPTRLIQTPAWQLKTAFAHKVAPNSPPDIGGIITVIQPDGSFECNDHRFKLKQVKPWRPE